MQRSLMRPEMNGPEEGARVGRLAPRNGAVVQMPAALRLTVFAACALLWLSGVLWLVLHFGFEQHTQFGPLPNPWEPAVMRLHGLLAVGGVFLLGWMAAGHVLTRWSSARNRISGLALAGSAALLIASGYALYYTTGTLHEVASRTHEWLGTASLLAALAHWWRIRTTR
jgi:hypothetical protein